MSELKQIPVVAEPARPGNGHAGSGAPRSGEKYLTPQGYTAIKDGIKAAPRDLPARSAAGDSAARPAAADRIGLTGKPRWLKAPLAAGERFEAVRRNVREHGLATVCEEAKCPNIGECWNAGTATIMLMGAVCTRACRFCAVDTGNPRGSLDAAEPAGCVTSCSRRSIAMISRTAAPGITPPACGRSRSAAPRPRSRR
jgi:lipoic acid synthetase